MLQSMFIQNFKAWENQTFTFNGEHAVFVGGDDSGKTSVLQALDCFFNRDRIDSAYVRDRGNDVRIGVRYGGVTFRKTFSGKTCRVLSCEPAERWHEVESLHYLLLPSTLKGTDAVLKELAKAKADQLLPDELQRALALVAQKAMGQVLSGAGIERAQQATRIKVDATPKVVPARAIDFTVQGVSLDSPASPAAAPDLAGAPAAAGEDSPAKAGAWKDDRRLLTYAMLVGSSYRNVILGVDDVEHVFDGMDFEEVIAGLEAHMGQVLMTTRSHPVVRHKGRAVAVPVGSEPGAMAAALRGMEDDGKCFLLVEGKYDLSWYRTAVQLLGLDDRFNILPAGGTNLEELLREMHAIGMDCIAIVDGDTPPNERAGKFALKRECVELYTPDVLLRELYGTIPPKDRKRAFFSGIQSTRQASENGIKAAISERIAQNLTPHSPFVVEVGRILERAMR